MLDWHPSCLLGMLTATKEPCEGNERTFVNARKEASLYRDLQEGEI